MLLIYLLKSCDISTCVICGLAAWLKVKKYSTFPKIFTFWDSNSYIEFSARWESWHHDPCLWRWLFSTTQRWTIQGGSWSNTCNSHHSLQRGIVVHKNSLAFCQWYRHTVESRALTCPFKQCNLSAWSLLSWHPTNTYLWGRLCFIQVVCSRLSQSRQVTQIMSTEAPPINW